VLSVKSASPSTLERKSHSTLKAKRPIQGEAAEHFHRAAPSRLRRPAGAEQCNYQRSWRSV